MASFAQRYDYVIVGAGSAGCVLANRLSRDPTKQVLLLEAGGSDRHPYVTMPKGIGKIVQDPAFAWHFPIAQPRAPDLPASEIWVRGKTLGGSSSVNGMIYIRGQRQDYEDWEEKAGSEWGWPAMKAAFLAMEDHDLGGSEDRGAGGPLHVSSGRYRYPLSDAMVAAGETMGLPRKRDLNDGDQEGVGYYSHTIRRGRRVSAARAFLDPARSRPNLTIVTQALVERILFDRIRACGVRARVAGRTMDYRCAGEVILSAGAIQSPKILQLSGIGDGAILRAAGVDVLVHSPDVGGRMREHLGFSMPHHLKRDAGLNRHYRGPGLILQALRYYARRDGPLATGPFEVGAFVRTDPASARPDAQLYLGGFTFARSKDNFPVQLSSVDRQPGFTIYGQMLRPTSEGTVHIRSADVDDPPVICPNWLSTEHDRTAAVAMIRFMRRYVRQPALAPYLGDEIVPGAAAESDADILAAFQRLSTSGLHGVATCRMGRDNSSVVDETLRVRGVDGLRIADCSVMPSPVSGNTNGPAMALGWRAAMVMG